MAKVTTPAEPTQEEIDSPDMEWIAYHSGNSTDADGNVTKVYSRVTMEAYRKSGRL
jgi:hypothetical protein